MEKKEETFLLVSLEEDKAKKLAQVISNDSCRKILDYLTKKKATETEIAQALGLPLSTVHYNLKHLVDNRLVEAAEFHYSEKGREVLHYSLSNKYVIIAPKGVSESFKDKLRSIIGAVASVGFIALALQYVPRMFSSMQKTAMESVAPAALQKGAERIAENAPSLLTESAQDSSFQAASAAQAAQAYQPVWPWFVIGAIICLLLYLLFEYIRKRRKTA